MTAINAHRWRFQAMVFAAVLATTGVLFGTAQAQGVTSTPKAASVQGAQSSSPEKAHDILQRIQAAAKLLNYHGVFAQQQNGAISSFRITHRFDGTDEVERLEVLDDRPREYLRLNDRVQCLVPDQKLVIVESQRQERFPALLMSDLEMFSEHYRLVVSPKLGRVAGRECVQLSIMAKDGFRPSYRLCADRETGLLLKAKMLGAGGVVLEQIAFSQVDIGRNITDEALAARWSTDGWRLEERAHSPIDLRAQGWVYTEPSGYRPILQVQRAFRDDRQVSQVILSDGLARISIFIEPFQQELSHHHSVGASRAGSMNLYGKRVDDYWIMVVGEVPLQAIQALAQSIDRKP